MAMISVGLYSCIIALVVRGQVWRERLGTPTFDKDL